MGGGEKLTGALVYRFETLVRGEGKRLHRKRACFLEVWVGGVQVRGGQVEAA